MFYSEATASTFTSYTYECYVSARKITRLLNLKLSPFRSIHTNLRLKISYSPEFHPANRSLNSDAMAVRTYILCIPKKKSCEKVAELGGEKHQRESEQRVGHRDSERPESDVTASLLVITPCCKQGSSKANSCSASQIRSFLNTKIHYYVDKSHPIAPILSQMNPAHFEQSLCPTSICSSLPYRKKDDHMFSVPTCAPPLSTFQQLDRLTSLIMNIMLPEGPV
jgi:hypothetical protein